MAENVDIIVSVIDKASAELEHIAGSFKTNLDAAAGASIAVATGLAGLVTAMGAVGVKAINDARESVAATNQLNAVLKSTGEAAGLTAEDITDQATALSKLTNYTDDAVVAGQNMLLTFTNIKGPVFQEATQTLLDMSTAMGTDVKSSAIQLGKALNDPTQGLTALTRVGVTFNQSQQDTIKRLQETGHTAEAQKVILAELAKEFGGSAVAVADPIIQLKNQIGELSEDLGKKLLPYVDQAVTAFSHWLDSMGGIDGIIDKIKAAFEAIEPFIPLIAGALIGALVPALYAAATGLWAFMAPLLPFIAVGALIGGAIYLIYLGVKQLEAAWPSIKAAFEAAWDAIVAKFDAVKVILIDAFNALKAAFDAIWEGIKMAFELAVELIVGIVVGGFSLMGIDIVGIFEGIVATLTDWWERVKTTFTAGLDYIKTIWNTAWTGITTFVKTQWDNIKTGFQTALNDISAIFSPWIETLKGAWQSMWSTVSTAATSAWDAAKNIVKEGINWVIGKVNDLINAINSVITKGAAVLHLNAVTIPTIPMLAQGGTITSSGAAIVGDAGPELLELPQGARVTPLSGAGGITINIINPMVLSDADIVEKIGDPIIEVLKQHAAIV